MADRTTANLARMRADRESDWPDRLINNLAKAPLVEESMLERPQPGRAAQFLQAASYGMTVEMTAELYGVGGETVRTTLKRVRRQLGAKNVTQACCIALRRGLIR